MMLFCLQMNGNIKAGSPIWFDIAWSPDGSKFVAVGAGVMLFTENAEAIEGFYWDDSHFDSDEENLQWVSVSWSSGGNRFATIDTSCSLSIWDAQLVTVISTNDVCTSTDVELMPPVVWSDRRETLLASAFDRSSGDIKLYSWYLSDLRLVSENGLKLFGYDFFPGMGSDDHLSINVDQNEVSYSARKSGSDTDNLMSADRSCFLRIVNISTEAVKDVFTPGCVNRSTWSSDGKLAFAGSGFLGIYTGDAQENIQMLYTPDEHSTSDGPMDLDWSPNGRYLAITYLQNNFEIWNVESGTLVPPTEYEFEDEGGAQHALRVAWQPAGMKIALIDSWSEIHILNVSDLA
jgi:WD40 repeat protein